jgi:acetylornithine deacetylase
MQDRGGAAQKLVFELCGHQHAGVVPYAAEAGQFQERGFEVVLCGPGSIDQAHQPNEYIDVEQVSACERFLEQLADRLCA